MTIYWPCDCVGIILGVIPFYHYRRQMAKPTFPVQSPVNYYYDAWYSCCMMIPAMMTTTCCRGSSVTAADTQTAFLMLAIMTMITLCVVRYMAMIWWRYLYDTVLIWLINHLLTWPMMAYCGKYGNPFPPMTRIGINGKYCVCQWYYSILPASLLTFLLTFIDDWLWLLPVPYNDLQQYRIDENRLFVLAPWVVLPIVWWPAGLCDDSMWIMMIQPQWRFNANQYGGQVWQGGDMYVFNYGSVWRISILYQYDDDNERLYSMMMTGYYYCYFARARGAYSSTICTDDIIIPWWPKKAVACPVMAVILFFLMAD